MRQAEELGLEGFLIKPVSPSVLFDAIIQVLGKDVQKVSRVDHEKEDKAEVEEFDVFGNQSMGTDHNVNVATGQPSHIFF